MPEERDLTPSEELVLEVLASRYRLGHNEWPFSSKHRKVLNSLQSKNYIYVESGKVQNTYDVSLTAKGKEATVSETYTPPIYKFVKDEYVDAFIIK